MIALILTSIAASTTIASSSSSSGVSGVTTPPRHNNSDNIHADVTPLQSPITNNSATTNATAASSVYATPNATPRKSSISTPSSSSASRRPARMSVAEINEKWKQIFATMEKWTADEEGDATNTHSPSATSSSKGIPSNAAHSTPGRIPSSFASALASQEAYENALDLYARSMQGYEIQREQHARLVQAATAQKLAGGPRKGERLLTIPPMPPAPIQPSPPPLTPYAPALAQQDQQWRKSLADNPNLLRGDAFDYKSVESHLMEYLHRDNHPLTLMKESFVANFLEAYSSLKNPALKGCTTNQASDLLLANTLPTLLYFLELLCKLLQRLFPELDASRNPLTMESIRQSCMESIFPSIFPTLIALYKRKYFFRDAELSSKMHVLASTGTGGCNITLEDMGVSKYLALDERLVLEEREKIRHKRRLKEREKRKALGETDEQRIAREVEEDQEYEANEANIRSKLAAMQANSNHRDNSIGHDHSSNSDTAQPISSLASPPHIPRNQVTRFELPHSPEPNENNENHPIDGLTHDADDVNPSNMSTPLTTPRQLKPRVDESDLDDSRQSSPSTETETTTTVLFNSKSTPSTPHRIGSSHSRSILPSPVRMIPQARLSPVMGFDQNSLGRSPRAEKIQDLLSRSPSRRIPAGSPTNSGLATSHSSRGVQSDGTLNASPQTKPRSLALSFSATVKPAPDAATQNDNSDPESTIVASDAKNHSTIVISHVNTSDPVCEVVRTPSPSIKPLSETDQATSGRKQVGFSANSEDVSPTQKTPVVNNGVNTSPQSSSLSLALKQRRPNSSVNPSAAFDAQSAPPQQSILQTPPKSVEKDSALGLLGFANGSLPEYQGDLNSDDEESMPRMPNMEGAPVLGSSMPMLQGLPSSMLTHTPGQGSELLKRELRQKKQRTKGMVSNAAVANGTGVVSSVQHLNAQQPFVMHSSPSFAAQLKAVEAAPRDGSDVDTTNNSAIDNMDDSEYEGETYPFQEAVVLLRRLTSERTPRDKLQCLIAVSQEVCWCVDRFYSRPIFQLMNFRPKPEDLCINADDLLSIVSFILIKSQLANVISEAAFIDDFISRGMKLHLAGYFLATLQASIELVSKLDRNKFLTREMVEQELRDSSNTTTNPSPISQRRPSYLSGSQSSGALNGLSSSLPRPQSKPMDAAVSTSNAAATSVDAAVPNATAVNVVRRANGSSGLFASSSQPKAGGILHPQALTLNPGQHLQSQPHGKTAVSPSSRANASSSTASTAASSASSKPALRLGMPPSLPSSGNNSAIHSRSSSFYSSPGARVEAALAQSESGLGSMSTNLVGAIGSGSWTQPFDINVEHFSNPNSPAKPSMQKPPIRKLAQLAMGQTRGV